MNKILLYLVIYLTITSTFLHAKGEEKVKQYEFENIHSININAPVGNIDIFTINSDNILVLFRNDLKDPDIITTEIDTDRGVLNIIETVSANEPAGRTSWIILLPKKGKMKSINCFSGLGNISLDKTRSDIADCNAATGDIFISDGSFREVNMTTTSGSIGIQSCNVDSKIHLISATGDIKLRLDLLPSTMLHAASTTGEIDLNMADLPKSYEMTLMKNADQGQIDMPFNCDNFVTKKYHKDDLYMTDICKVIKGMGGSKIELITGSGHIYMHSP